jgi:hypothetical protein
MPRTPSRLLHAIGFSLVLSLPLLGLSLPALSGGICSPVATPSSFSGTGHSLRDGLEARVNPRLSVRVPENPRTIIHNNSVMVVEYPTNEQVAFHEVSRADLPELPDGTTLIDFLRWAFDTHSKEVPSHPAGEFAKAYARAFCLEGLKSYVVGELKIYAGKPKDGGHAAFVVSANDPHGFMQLSAFNLSDETFLAIIESIQSR